MYMSIITWTYVFAKIAPKIFQFVFLATKAEGRNVEAMSKYLFGAVMTCGPWSGALESTLGFPKKVMGMSWGYGL